jgi:hypothetical protein
MATAALITWVITALGGFWLLGSWLSNGGMRQQQSGLSSFRVPLIFGHLLLAAGGLVVWIVYVITENDGLTWVAFGILLVVALLGFTMFARWLGTRRAAPAAGPGTASAVPAERQLPVAVVLLHGLVAATTLVLVLLTALGTGS